MGLTIKSHTIYLYDQQVWVDIGHSNFSSYLKLLINLHSQYSSTQKLYSSRNELQQ